MSEPLTEKQIEQIRRDVAKAYHDLMIDLAMKGEGQVGNRRFWRDEENVIRWEDLPDDAGGTDRETGDGDVDAAGTVPASAEPTRRHSRAQRNRRAAVIAGQDRPSEPKRHQGGGK